jgi:hypothetical protein
VVTIDAADIYSITNTAVAEENLHPTARWASTISIF